MKRFKPLILLMPIFGEEPKAVELHVVRGNTLSEMTQSELRDLTIHLVREACDLESKLAQLETELAIIKRETDKR